MDPSPTLLTALCDTQAEKRKLVSAILERSAKEWADAAGTIDVSLSTAHVDVVAGATATSDVTVHNAGKSPAIFSVCAHTNVRFCETRAQSRMCSSHQFALHKIYPCGRIIILIFHTEYTNKQRAWLDFLWALTEYSGVILFY